MTRPCRSRPRFSRNTLRHGLCTFKQWASRNPLRRTSGVCRRTSKRYSARYNRVATGKRCSRRMAHWFPTSAFPSRSRRSASFKVWPGTHGKVHLIYNTEAIEEARKQGKLTVNNFIPIEKRFAKKKPVLGVDDMG